MSNECKMLDLREHDGRYYFRFGNGADFNKKLAALKDAFHWQERKWHHDSKEWGVPANEESEARLCAVFPNAANCFTTLHSQLRLF